MRILVRVTTSSGWTFLADHGHVLVGLAADPEVRVRDAAGIGCRPASRRQPA